TGMAAAERQGELVAHFAAERLFLGKADVMRIARPAGAHEARLRGDEREVGLVAQESGRADRQRSFVYTASPGSRFGVGGAEPSRWVTRLAFRRGPGLPPPRAD